MKLFIGEIGYMFLLLIPTFAIIFSMARERKRNSALSVKPFEELQRRPAGESARLELEKHWENLQMWFMAISFTPVVIALGLTFERHANLVLVTVSFLVVAIFAAVAQRKIRSLLEKCRCYRLGFEGERYVAEELNQLMANGFRVFHDVPFDTYNIDHVLVGPTGVFAVETKTRRKPVSKPRGKRLEVTFDGKTLHFPNCYDTDAVEQIVRNKDSLSKWLSSATADHIEAYGILAIPGWWVEENKATALLCLNPKRIRGAVLAASRAILTAGQIQRASHQLSERCKLAVL